ncbi:MAG: Gfo/Idh/MocA family oxidoreductase [Eubacteriales bacterium]
MRKIRYGVIGSGWRAEFYIRISKQLNEYFDLAAVLIREKEKGEEFAKKFHVNIVQTIEQMKQENIEFVVLSIKREIVAEYLPKLYQLEIPVLCETPPSNDEGKLITIWEDFNKYKGKIQIAEQYLFQPLYASWHKAIGEGMIGEVQNINISALHGYHASYIMRKFLGIGYESCKIQGERFHFQVVETGGRDGACYHGNVVESPRERLTIKFENGKVGFFDFSFTQYHSYIRTRQLNVQGTKGEIDDLDIRYIGDENEPIHLQLNRIDLGVYNNQEWTHKGIMLGDQYLYKNPFVGARLNDDEIAIASCLYKMREYIESGVEFYSLREALQDSYIAVKMEEALKGNQEEIKGCKQCWYTND